MRRKHSKGPTEIQLGTIITPMLDMAFQMLAFFIMTYHPSALEGHVDGDLLPPTKASTKGPKTEMKDDLPLDTEPDLTQVLMVQIKAVVSAEKTRLADGKEEIRNPGQASRILLKRPESLEPDLVADSQITFKDGLRRLKGELEKFRNERKKTEEKTDIKIEADGDLMHQYAMEVFDICKVAGFQNVKLVAPPDLGPK